MTSNYDKTPRTESGLPDAACAAGWDAIAARVAERLGPGGFVLAIECYPGVAEVAVAAELERRLGFTRVVRTSEALLPAGEIEAKFAHELTADPVFGVRSRATLADFFDRARAAELGATVARGEGRRLVVGPGASLLAPAADLLVYADMPRWEIQGRQRRNEIGNLGLDNLK